ncbi:hypothetical protein M404DRAFT_374084 [Pisolithus tinctorius Marx 270]|uniref:Uncharacterized protein n=1 Tax=Pisolithus tinctorius Marx 270 TaxID=870435 RepID=A0A0C3NGJ2_PISTI|nr:hypothetical protein M404DRAFT_374084 [Pisolithus tinctorius Marx 270]
MTHSTSFSAHTARFLRVRGMVLCGGRRRGQVCTRNASLHPIMKHLHAVAHV